MYKKSILNLLLTSALSTHVYAGKTDYSCFEQPFDSSKNRIAVADVSFDTTHPLIKDNLENPWHVVDKTSIVSPDIHAILHDHKLASHGTHVAGIITQLSPSSRIVPIAFSGSDYQDYALLKLLSPEYHDIRIINLSAVIRDRFEHMRKDKNKESIIGFIIKELAKQGKVLVVTAGNQSESLDESEDRGRLIMKLLQDSVIREHLVIVGATQTYKYRDSEITERALYSNYPGVDIIKRNFICAQGTMRSSIPIFLNKGDMEEQEGTSMAAPVVTAYLGKLMQEYNITSAKALKVLFKTAIKISSEKDNKMFISLKTGQGIADIDAAFEYMNKKRNKYFANRQQEQTKE